MDVTVVVATFGDEWWKRLAWKRAIPSALAQAPCVHSHRDSLVEARNAGVASVESEWIIHLDADDELEPGYVDALGRGRADLRAPSVRYVQGGRVGTARQPRVARHRHNCSAGCLSEGNWLVVGTAVRTELARKVGGWRDFPWSEDWSLWLRCYLAGATVEACPDAVYRAHVRPDSRNRSATHAEKLVAHKAIYDDAFGVAA